MAVRQLYELMSTMMPQCMSLLDDDVGALMETADIQAIQQAYEKRLLLLEPLQNALTSLHLEIENLRTAPLRIRNWERPAVSLPVEILASVFEEACDVHEPPQIDQKTRAAIIGTCSRWRYAGVSNAALWSTFSIATIFGPRLSPPAQLLQLGVDRSLNRPLRLFLSLRSGDDAPKDFQDIVESMGPRCDLVVASGNTRCLWDPSIIPLGLIARVLRVLSSQMRTLVLDFIETSSNQGPGKVDLTHTSSIDSLRVSFSGRFSRDLCLLHPTAWCVRRLCLAGAIDLSSAISAINACHKLETLEWIHKSNIAMSSFETSSTQLRPQNALLSLSLEGHFLLDCLQRLQAPNLSRLCLRFPNVHIIFDWASSVHPRIRDLRFPSLRNFELMVGRPLPASIVTLFSRAHPALEVLILHGLTLDKEFAQFLGAPAPEDVLPSLRDIWCDAVDPSIVWVLLRHRAPPFVVHAPYLWSSTNVGRVRSQGRAVDEGGNKLELDQYEDEVWNWYTGRYFS